MWRRIRYWWHLGEREKLLREEMDTHVAMLADAFEEDGMPRKRRSTPRGGNSAAG